MVLAATIIPIELRRPDLTQLSLTAFRFDDVVFNIVGYWPVGVSLATLNPARAAAVAMAMATFAEASQLFMVHRQPSVVDIACNVLGATLGALAVSRRRKMNSPITLDRRTAAVAAILAAALILLVWWRSPPPLNSRGSTAPGTLEAYWKFDESQGRLAVDSSAHGLDGVFSNRAKRVPGVFGNAVSLDGVAENVFVGRTSALGLVGSVTISAWIKPKSFPSDDAAIVSSHNGVGYQLDTTVDRGARTIGFKLGNACGELMARYGATPLVAGRWYHVAGVYDARAQSMDVYLNGTLDNGFLLGTITGTQHRSREAVYIGRRSGDRGFEFAGLIDDVRIYSRALTSAEIKAEMSGMPVAAAQPLPLEPVNADHLSIEHSECSGASDREDSRLPGAASVVGVLVAVAYVGFWPTAALLPCLLSSVVAGLLLLPGAASSLPLLGGWLIPSASLAGAISVLASLSGRDFDRHVR